MTIDALTMMVVDVLGRYIIDGGAVLVREAGESAARYATQLCELVLDRLKTDPAAARNVKGFQKYPQGYQAPVAEAVAEQVKSDPEFAAQLSRLIDEFKKAANAKDSVITEIRSRTAVMHGGIAAGEGGVAVSGNVTGGISISNTQSDRSTGGSDR